MRERRTGPGLEGRRLTTEEREYTIPRPTRSQLLDELDLAANTRRQNEAEDARVAYKATLADIAREFGLLEVSDRWKALTGRGLGDREDYFASHLFTPDSPVGLAVRERAKDTGGSWNLGRDFPWSPAYRTIESKLRLTPMTVGEAMDLIDRFQKDALGPEDLVFGCTSPLPAPKKPREKRVKA